MAKESTTYSETMAQIEEIIHSFNSDKFDIDTLTEEVKKATNLIAVCKAKLLKAEREVTKILTKND